MILITIKHYSNTVNYFSFQDGDFERIDNLLKRRSDGVVNVDVKDKETGNTALLWAAKRGHIKVDYELNHISH